MTTELYDNISKTILESISVDRFREMRILKDVSGISEIITNFLPLPVPMILHCPRCWFQHIDLEESEEEYQIRIQYLNLNQPPRWLNPPHKKHLCSNCQHLWTPALIPTIGVEKL